jgi:hypothetical protein
MPRYATSAATMLALSSGSISSMMRVGAIIVLSIAACAPRVFAQGGSPDPLFASIPFERWVAEGGRTKLRWTVGVSGGQLSSHQRLLARVTIELDGEELDKRRGQGQLILLVQFKDSADRVYQTHQSIELKEVREAARSQSFVYTQDAFVTPGDYRVTFAIFATATQEHTSAQRTLHVAALKNDPLSASWQDLPPVEFLPDASPPDSWYLPSVSGRLRLPLETRRPVRIELLVNLTPSEQASAMRRNSRTLAALIPALKVISEVNVRNGSLNIAALDLARRRVSFEQDSSGDLDWPRLKLSLAQADPNVIDVHSLENRGQNAQFFVTEVSRRIAAGGEPVCILIVLSPPVVFDHGENLHPIHTSNDLNCQAFYIRYYSRSMGPPSAPPLPRSPSRRHSIPPTHSVSGADLDSLEQTLKPLKPRLFDVYSPEQFRKALGALLDEISRI